MCIARAQVRVSRVAHRSQASQSTSSHKLHPGPNLRHRSGPSLYYSPVLERGRYLYDAIISALAGFVIAANLEFLPLEDEMA